MEKKMKGKGEKKLLEEIKTLLILIAYKSGAKQGEIGKCLGVGQARIAKILTGFTPK